MYPDSNDKWQVYTEGKEEMAAARKLRRRLDGYTYEEALEVAREIEKHAEGGKNK